MLQIVQNLSDKGVGLISMNEQHLDTNTPQGKFMLTVFAAFAELERARSCSGSEMVSRFPSRGQIQGTEAVST